MADYDPLIPIATDNLSVSVGEIQNNFQQINELYGSNAGADHYAFDYSTTPSYRGLHKQVTFSTPLGAAPSPSNPTGILYPLADPNDSSGRTQLYYKNGSTTHQVTNRFKSAGSSGYVMFPTTVSSPAIIMMWGQVNTASSGNVSVSFPNISNYTGSPSGFPNNVFQVTLSVEATTSGSGSPNIVIDQGSLSTTGFTLRVSASLSGTVTHWIAIGN